MMTEREFVQAFILARAGAVNGKMDIYGDMYDAGQALKQIDEKYPAPKSPPAPPDSFLLHKAPMSPSADDDIPF